MPPLATLKKITTFASLYSFNSDVNHRIYSTLHKRLGVVYSYSYGIAVSECSNFGKATLSLFQFFNFLKFFTNATLSKRFSSAEEQYAVTNAQPSDRRATNQKRTKKKEPRKATPLPAIRLLLRELHRYVRGISATVVQDISQRRKNRYPVCTDQRQRIFRQRQNIPQSLPKTDAEHTSFYHRDTGKRIKTIPFILYNYYLSLHRYGVV